MDEFEWRGVRFRRKTGTERYYSEDGAILVLRMDGVWEASFWTATGDVPQGTRPNAVVKVYADGPEEALSAFVSAMAARAVAEDAIPGLAAETLAFRVMAG